MERANGRETPRASHAWGGRDGALIRYGSVLPILMIAVVIRVLLAPFLGSQAPFITFFPAIMVAAWIGGRGPGLCATAGAAAASFSIEPLAGPVSDPTRGWNIGLAFFAASGVAMSFLAGRFHRIRREAEARARSLEELAERVEMAQKASSSGIWEWHVAEGAWRWTDATARLFGLPPGSPARTELWRERVVAEDLALFDDLWGRILGAEPPREFDFRFRVAGPGGSEWRRTRGRVEIDAAGRAVRVLGLTLDIGDEVADELALRESESRFQAVLRSISALVYVKDLEGRLVLVNPHYEKMLGTAGRSVIGGDERDLLGEEETRQIRSNEATVLATGEARRFEESIRMRDGTVRTYVSVKVPLRGVDGTIEGVCGVSTDITELRLREEELRDSEERLRSSERLYRAIGESIDYGVWICDATGRNVYTSESMLRLIGITQEECSGLGWTSALHPDEAAATRAAWERCVAEGSFWEREQRFRRTDGTWRHVLTRGIPIRDDAGRVTAWAGINLDVDAFKRAQEALEESDRRKDEFLAMLSHELRNPLNAVVGATSLLDRLAREDEGTARAREVIARQTRHLTRLLDDLLDVTRVTSGKIILQREPMRLDRVVEECVATFRLEGRASGQDLVFSADQPVWVSADRTRIEQVISNLLVNAVKYTPHGGTIRVSVGRRGEEAELEVADTGAGLPSDLLPRVFDLFVQGDRTVDRAQGGLGIGLTLVKRIAELHDGTVSAASTGPGDGSVFTVRLPALVREPVVERAPAVETPARRRILVVEDHEDSRVTLRRFLELDGHEVREAGDGRAGLRIALDWRPDVALVDLGLPEMDGLELAAALRAAGDPQPYLIALTGYGRPEDVRRAQDAGFRAHLTKPFEPASLARVLAESAMSRGVEVRSAADTSSTAPD